MIDSKANNEKIHPDYPDPTNTEEIRVEGVNRKDQDRGPFKVRDVTKNPNRPGKRQVTRSKGR